MSFPQELKNTHQWVCWRMEQDKDGGKPKKKPLNPVTGKGAMSNNPQTWSDYRTAFDAYERYSYTGIGFVFTKEDAYVGVDIDHCYDPETAQFSELAQEILARQPTYTEFSPSGTGVHLYFKGKKPPGSNKNTENGVEMYDSDRYFTVTGKQVDGFPDDIAEDEGALEWIYTTYIKKQKKTKTKKKRLPAALL